MYYITPYFNYPRLETQTINVLHHTLLQLPTTPNTDNQRITPHPASTTHDSKHRQSTYYTTPCFNYPRLQTQTINVLHHTLLQLPTTLNTDNQRITSHPTSTTHDSKHRQSTYFTTPCFNYPRLQTQTINVLHHTLLQLPTTPNTDNQRITSHPTSTTHDSKHIQSTYYITPYFNYPRLQTQTINVLHHTLLQLPTTRNTDNQRITPHPASTTHDSKHRQSTYYTTPCFNYPRL